MLVIPSISLLRTVVGPNRRELPGQRWVRPDWSELTPIRRCIWDNMVAGYELVLAGIPDRAEAAWKYMQENLITVAESEGR